MCFSEAWIYTFQIKKTQKNKNCGLSSGFFCNLNKIFSVEFYLAWL